MICPQLTQDTSSTYLEETETVTVISHRMPFRFVSCTESRESLGRRAQDVHRLHEILEEGPVDSIYYQTHGYSPRHPHTYPGAVPYDFATWVARPAQDRVLGERLGVVGPFDFDDTEALWAQMVGLTRDDLDHASLPVSARVSEPFEFIRSHLIEVDLYLEVATYQQFRDLELMAVIGRRAEEFARHRLITRQLQDYLSVMIHLPCQGV